MHLSDETTSGHALPAKKAASLLVVGGMFGGSCAVEGDPSGPDAPVMAAVGIEGGSSMGNPSRHQLGVEMQGKATQRTIRDALF